MFTRRLSVGVRIAAGILILSLPAAYLWAQNPPEGAPPAAAVKGKGKGKGGGAPKQPSRPTPRWPDGHPMLGAPPGETGYWNSGTGGLVGRNGNNLPTNLESADEIPFMDWSRALYEERRRTQSKDDPHVRCVGPGGPRQFHTPFGLLIYELREARRVLVLSGGGPRTWRVIYTDGRPHPSSDDFNPTYMGHSVGKWEGDTLVVDSVGFNEKFWFARAGYPHTEALHLIERISRPDMDTLRYEVTIDDPRTYTRPWTGGHYISWVPNADFEEYFCQDNNRDITHMVGQ